MFAALPFVVAAFTSVVPTSADEADAPTIAAEVLAGAERVTAVHELAGAVAFDLIDDGQRWQLTVALDDDGAVIDTALGRLAGDAPRARGRQPSAPIRLARVARIDRDDRGRLVLRDGARGRRIIVPSA